MTHKHTLIGKGVDPKIAEEMADPTGERAALRQSVFKWTFIVVSAVALWVVGARWAEVKADDRIAAQAAQIEQLEYIVAACQSTGGFHIDGIWHRCVLQEIGK